VTSQLSLDYGQADRIERGRDELADALFAAVKELGWKRSADACGARQQDLNDALRDRQGRHIRIEWIWAIADAAGGDFKARIVEAVNRPVGMTAVPSKILTPEDRLARLENRVIEKLGPLGLQIVEENRR
jgi:hypothetical protein